MSVFKMFSHGGGIWQLFHIVAFTGGGWDEHLCAMYVWPLNFHAAWKGCQMWLSERNLLEKCGMTLYSRLYDPLSI